MHNLKTTILVILGLSLLLTGCGASLHSGDVVDLGAVSVRVPEGYDVAQYSSQRRGDREVLSRGELTRLEMFAPGDLPDLYIARYETIEDAQPVAGGADVITSPSIDETTTPPGTLSAFPGARTWFVVFGSRGQVTYYLVFSGDDDAYRITVLSEQPMDTDSAWKVAESVVF